MSSSIIVLFLLCGIVGVYGTDTCDVIDNLSVGGNGELLGDMEFGGDVTIAQSLSVTQNIQVIGDMDAGNVNATSCSADLCTMKESLDSATSDVTSLSDDVLGVVTSLDEAEVIINAHETRLDLIEPDITALEAITTDGTLCLGSTCTSLTTQLYAFKYPVFFHAIINTGSANLYTFATSTAVLFGTEVVDRNSTYAPGSGTFTAPSAGYYQYGFSVTIDTMSIASGGTDTVTFTCGIVFVAGAAADATVVMGAYTRTGGFPLSTTGIILMNTSDAIQVKCILVANSGAVTSIHVGSGNFHVLKVSSV